MERGGWNYLFSRVSRHQHLDNLDRTVGFGVSLRRPMQQFTGKLHACSDGRPVFNHYQRIQFSLPHTASKMMSNILVRGSRVVFRSPPSLAGHRWTETPPLCAGCCHSCWDATHDTRDVQQPIRREVCKVHFSTHGFKLAECQRCNNEETMK